jgi:hypothetical protein
MRRNSDGRRWRRIGRGLQQDAINFKNRRCCNSEFLLVVSGNGPDVLCPEIYAETEPATHG